VIVREAGGSVDAPLVPVRSAASAASALAPGDPGRPVVASNGFLHTTLVTALHEAHHGIPPA
jgi:hypothetical protein